MERSGIQFVTAADGTSIAHWAVGVTPRLWIAAAVATVLIASACSGEATGTTASTPPGIDQASTTSVTPTSTTTAAVPIEAAIEHLIVNGSIVEMDNGTYALPGTVDPGDELVVEVSIRDDDFGSFGVLDREATYSPAEGVAKTSVRVVIPADLRTAELPILLNGEDAGVIVFEPGGEWAPIVVVDAPVEATVGERVVLDASASFDHNGDSFEVEWSQARNPDRYSGSEYVTSQRVELETASGPVTGFTAEWPGNYRFIATASDDSGVGSVAVDVAVHPSGDVLSIRGMAIDGTSPEGWSTSNAVAMLEYLKDLGFNYIQVGLHDTMASPSSNEILIDSCAENWVPALDRYVELIDLAHDTGLSVMLSPAMGCNIDETWYEFYNITPTDPDAWMASYLDYAGFYAELAEEHDVEILNLGGGMYQFYGHTSRWDEVITSVRSVYNGRLAFSWFDWAPFPERSLFRFPYPERLDIFVNAFNWNGTGNSFTGDLTGHNFPEIPEMMEYFGIELSRYLDGLQAQYQKSVIATDLFPWPVDGMNINPLFPYSTPEEEWVPDQQEPIDYAEAAFRTMIGRGWEGMFFWALKVGPPLSWEPDIRGEPIEDMLRIWFTPR